MADETTLTPERIAHTFHDAYEALAPAFGYRTRAASSKPWEQIPASNRDLMIATVRAVFYERDGAFFVCGPSAPIAAAQVETLTRERDEARRDLGFAASTLRTEQRICDEERQLRKAAEAEVERVTRERDEARSAVEELMGTPWGECEAIRVRAEVSRLTREAGEREDALREIAASTKDTRG